MSFRFSHHASPSGYDALNRFLGEAIQAEPLPRWLIPDRLIWRLADGVVLYDRHSLSLEIKASMHAARHPRHIYHVIYGENSYKHLARWVRPRGSKVVATFHQPPGILEQLIKTSWPYRALDALVVLGHTQVPFFREMALSSKIHFVPYGVDADYFTPPTPQQPRQEGLCLCVGNWLRDFSALRSVAHRVHQERPRMEFLVVTLPENLEVLTGIPARILTGISDAELLALYRKATLLVQPLKDCVASTTLLEAMACGLPVVATDVGSIRDYVSPGAAVLTPPGDGEAMSEAILSLLDDRGTQEAMSGAARRRACEFHWPRVAEMLAQLYGELDDRA